jgi:hypothetical protein
MRLREAGKEVIGMGMKKTPQPFIAACNKFVYIEVLSHHCQQDSLSKTEPKSLPCNFYLCNICCNLNKSNYLFKKLNPII